MMDRPHIIYNEKTKKYVCWLKIMDGVGQSETVLTADNILGPYTVVNTGIQPLDMSAGDFDLAVAEDGKAYYYFERVHSETICADLTDDYTNVIGYYSTHFPKMGSHYVGEATAHFKIKGKHYLLTSGTSGYLPNPSEVAIGDTWHGPFTVQGNPHLDDESKTSFHSQISSVLKVEGKKDLYIACADRWLLNDMDLDYNFYKKFYENIFCGETHKLDEEKVKALGYDTRRNTSIADYVWLPLRFEGEKVFIDWEEEWRIEDYE